MNYDSFIQNIIDTRGQFNISDDVYFETHHIVPKCLGGLPKYNSKASRNPNLIRLFPEEHYLAHKLLAQKYPDNDKIVSAFWLMSNDKKTGRSISAEDYALARKLKQESMQGENNSFYGKKHSEETKNIIREKSHINGLGRPGTNNRPTICINTGVVYESCSAAAKAISASHGSVSECCRGKVDRVKGYYFAYLEDLEKQEKFAAFKGLPPSKADTAETKLRRSAASTGRQWSEESRRKASEAKKGIKKSPESVEKMKQTKASRTYVVSEERRQQASLNCKHKKKVLCVETGMIFDSVSATAKYIGVDKSRIAHCINGQSKTVKGFHFKHVEE